MTNISDLVVLTRRRNSSVSYETLTEALASDRSRIIYSPAFRRLARKAQVFSLESNAAVRNRMVHSLEVSNVGRLIAYQITEALIKLGKITVDLQLPIIYAVESACLVHDVGNPPFGHFGESAIRNWFAGKRGSEEPNWKLLFEMASEQSDINRMQELAKDFLEFDGNPQGFRILLRLKRENDVYSYNLTYTTLLSFLKYCRSTAGINQGGLTKKGGYFASEAQIVAEMKGSVGISDESRYLLAYIMEAADDIAYCISDIEDGIEKELISEADFFTELRDGWEKAERGSVFPFGSIPPKGEEKGKFFHFKIEFSRKAVDSATDLFVAGLDNLLLGKEPSLFPKNGIEEKAFDALKTVSRQKLFRARECEDIELAGNQVVLGLLERFRPLLEIETSDFEQIVLSRIDRNPNLLKNKGLDVQWRLFNRLPEKHVLAYCDQLEEFTDRDQWPEWYFRAHLIVDYISGMTDHYAVEQFQLLNGIQI